MALHYFGTDGVRGKAGSELTERMAYRIGRYLGLPIQGRKPRILLSRDTRESGEMLLRGLKEGIVATGGELFDEGVSTTPSISYLVSKRGFDYGVMISASHNPYYDNGIKIFNSCGEKLDDSLLEGIEAYMDAEEDDLPRGEGKYVEDPSLREDYLSWLLSKASPKVKGVKVLVDCANGSASNVAPELFRRLGLDATILCASPDGRNINSNCGSTHLEMLQKELSKGHYDFGFAFDGDADRFLAFEGDGFPLDGDRLIFVHALARRKAHKLPGNKVVITVMSNFGLRKALDNEGIGYEIVSVGDKYVQACLKEKGYVLGGEQSGHVIFLDELNTGDGLLGAIALLNVAVNDPESLAKARECKSYPQVLKNLRFDSREKMAEILANPQVKKVIDDQGQKLGENGRVLVRASGTEPLIRVMAEALDEAETQAAVDAIIAAIKARG